MVVSDHFDYYQHDGDQDQDGNRNVANGVAPPSRLLHLGVAVEAHGAHHNPAVVARRVERQARVLMAYLHAAPLLDIKVLLVAVAGGRVRAVISILANFEATTGLGVHLSSDDVASCGVVPQQELLISHSFVVLLNDQLVATA